MKKIGIIGSNGFLGRSICKISKNFEYEITEITKETYEFNKSKKFDLFIKSGSEFMPEIKNAQYLGSSFCIKTTLPNVDKTDERPTLINKINEKIVTVFSGKIPTCVEASNEIEKIVGNIEKEK